MNLSKAEVTQSLQVYKDRRDDVLHEDETAFAHNLRRLVQFCEGDPLVQLVLAPLVRQHTLDAKTWWQETCQASDCYVSTMAFPEDPSEELALRYALLKLADEDDNFVARFGVGLGKHKLDEWVNVFRVLIVRPFVDELSRRLSEAANLASPQARALLAVPLARIPAKKEVRIFLSHKSVDKPLVYRYYNTLTELGFDPWLDEEEMPAGTNLERGILKGFEESCAAVFFITENFKDESYLASEVDYSVIEKRKKGNKFAIITLRYSDAAPVPGLLTPYIFKTVSNDLDGFHQLLRALPVELGPVRWKEDVVD